MHDYYTEETDKDYGRLDVRRYWVTEKLSTLSNTARWSALRSIGLVERECWSEDRHTVERRVFITSIPADPSALPMRCVATGESKTACTGAWMSSSTKTPAVSAKAITTLLD